MKRLLFPSAVLLVLAACTERVAAPTAEITLVNGDPIVAGDLVVLDGSGSADAAENAEMELGFSYAWFLVSIPPGSEAHLNRTDVPVVSFVADAYGDYEVGLVVSNGVLTSPQATETVTVTACGHEAPLVASITATPTAPITDQVFQLSASVSDPDDDCTDAGDLSYTWTLTSVPAGSFASLNDPHLEDPSLTGDRPGDYTVELVVTDAIGLSSDPAALVVTVSDCGDAIPVVDTVDQDPDPAYTGDQVVLDLAVSDADIDTCLLDQGLQVHSTFLSRPAGSNAVFAPAEGLEPAFIADVPGAYAVRTTVTDTTGRSSFEDTDVTVGTCGASAPTVDTVVPTPADPLQRDDVTLAVAVSDADESTCHSEQVLTVHSEIVARPQGSSAVLDPADGLAPAFLADAAGPFVVRTTVTDDTGRWGYRDTVVDVDPCGAATPYVESVTWGPQPAFESDQVDLDLVVMDDDLQACRPGQALTVDSAFVRRPTGSTASMTGADGLTPSFVADEAGAYLVRTTVTDDTGLTSFLDTSIAVRLDECGIQPPVALMSVLSPISEGPLAVLEPTDPAWVDEPIWLDASDSYDLDIDPCGLSQTLTYSWWFTGLPRGADTDFNDPTVVNPSFVPNVPGTWEVALQVSDGTLDDLATGRFEVIPFSVTSVAPGFSIAFVDGETALWNDPQGIAVDDDGAIYVAQNGRAAVTVTDAGFTTDLSVGGYLDEVEDIVYDATRDQFFVTDSDSEGIVRIHSGTTQQMWASYQELRGITLFTDSDGTEVLVTADYNDDVIRFLNPSLTGPVTAYAQEDFSDEIDEPWGVAATVIDTTEWYFAADANNPNNSDELWRTDGAAQTDTETELVDFLWQPRDIVVSPSGQIVVADSGSTNVYLIDDCASPPCAVTTLASGDWEPYGLAWESDTELLVTDRAGDALYRITGPF